MNSTTKNGQNISNVMKYFVYTCTVTVNDNPKTTIKLNVNVSHLNLHIIVDNFNDTDTYPGWGCNVAQ